MATPPQIISSNTTSSAKIKIGDIAEGGSAKDTSKTRGGLSSPEGVLLLGIAIVIDGIGFLFFIIGTWFGIDDYGILDFIGLLIIGGWILLRSGSLNTEMAKKGLNRFLKAFIVEIIPFVGGVAPSWTWLVYKTLKEGDK